MTELYPQVGTHGKLWVYAAKDIVMSAIFAVNKRKCFGDFSLGIGRNPKTGKPYVCERYIGAFEDAYSGVQASIYILDGSSFKEGLTQWNEEVVSSETAKVKKEIKISNMKDHLNSLHKKEELEIYIYPDRPSWVPKDDQDLIDKAYLFSKTHGKSVWIQFERLHPHLMKKIKK
ncbi:MAG: hypothetical protein GY793_01055 [Proteobacteria bacterium]|nr:hypothetical protein [Pseudomonadota bacterium]